MAQYDGSIRINTQINTSGASSQLMTLENRIVKIADKIASLRSKMDSLKNAKISTQEYQEISAQIQKAEAEFNKLLEKQEQMQREGKDNGVAWERLNAKMEEVGNTIRYAQGELQDLVESGKAFTLGSDTQEYEKLHQQLEYLEGDYSVLIQRKKEFEQKNGAQTDGYERLRASLQELMSSTNRIMHPIESMKSAFSSAIASMKERAAGVAASIINGIAHPFQTMRSVASSAIKGTSKLLSGMASVAKKVGSAIKSMASRFLSIGKSSKSASGGIASMGMGFKNLLKYGLGIRSLYALVSKFRAAVKEGFGNLAQYSEPVNSALSSLKSSLTQLKNSLATAFAPIITAVAPALTALIDMVSKAATAVGMLIAALTGQKSFIKATKVQQGYADAVGNTASAAKDANKQLSSLDKLNNLTTNDSSGGGGGGGGGAGVGDMFETVDIPSKIKDLSDMIKKAWEDADFTEIGALIGTKLKEALEKIPWDKIQATAAKVGKSLATLINGFVEVEGLGYTIGNTIAQAINTALIGLESFATNLHWDSVGKFIAEGINGALINIDWNTALSAASHFGTGLADLLNNSLTPTVFANIGYTIGNGLNTAITFANDLVAKFEWHNFGANIGTGLSVAIKTIDTRKLGETLGGIITKIFQLVIGFAEKFEWKTLGEKISDGINGFFEKFDGKTVAQGATKLISGIFDTIIEATATIKWDEIWKDIIDFLVNVNWLELIGKLIIAAGQLIAGLNIGLIEAIAETDWGEVWDSIVQAFKDFFGIHSPSTLMEEQGNYLMEGLINGIEALIDSVKEKFGEIKEKILEKWEEVKENTKEKWESIKSDLSEKWENLKESASEKFSDIKQKISEKWEEVSKNTKEKWSDIKENVSEKWKDLKADAKESSKNIKDKVVENWESLKSKTKETWKGIKNGIKSPINGIIGFINKMISGIETGINALIRLLNGISIHIPDNPITGALDFGINIPEISVPKIPKLATGAVIPANREFLAVLGDQKHGTNIEAPLSTIEEAVENALNRNGGTGGVKELTIHIPFEVDGQVFFDLIKKLDLEQYNRTGRPSFQI